MRAAVRMRYGSADVVELKEVARPELFADGALVRVHATSVNQADWYGMTGRPYLAGRPTMGLFKPRSELFGTDLAGTVEAVGSEVTDLQPGDDVFGGRTGAFAEYVCARQVVRKPANVTFEEAAAVPIAGLTALQGLRDHGKLRPGQHVLVNCASGGVGTFAVQVAKALGAEVTAVCSTRNVEQARSLGADEVVDYTREDFTRSGQRYDLIFDIAVTRSWSQYRRVLKPDGTLVMVGAPKGRPMLGPLPRLARVRLASVRGSQRAVLFVAKFNKPDLAILGELLESGSVKPVVERRYELGEIAEALRYLGEGHARGKLVVTVRAG